MPPDEAESDVMCFCGERILVTEQRTMIKGRPYHSTVCLDEYAATVPEHDRWPWRARAGGPA